MALVLYETKYIYIHILLHRLECMICYIAQHCGIDAGMKRDQMEVQPTIPP